MMRIRVDDPKVARVLRHPAGRVAFAALFGFTFFETVSSFRALTEMAAAWERHVTNPALPAGDEDYLPPLSWQEPECVIGADPLAADHKLQEVPDGETTPVAS